MKTLEESETERKALKERFQPGIYAFAKRKDYKDSLAGAKAAVKDANDTKAIKEAIRASARRSAIGVGEPSKASIHPDRAADSSVSSVSTDSKDLK